jgi:transcriptional regulator with XRE-family HTH domain
VDVFLVIKQRLEELGFEQRELAAAAEVTESYVSQLLTCKKLPPAPARSESLQQDGEILEAPERKVFEAG